MKVYIFLLLISISSFANELNPHYVPKEIQPFYNDLINDKQFEQVPKIFKEKLENIVFKIVPLDQEQKFLEIHFSQTDDDSRKNFIALCDPLFNIIYLRESLLTKRSEYEIQEVFDHEVGHCVFGRIHNLSQTPYEDLIIPSSIMYPTIQMSNNEDDSKIYESSWSINHYKNNNLKKMYRQDLFNKNKFNEQDKVDQYRKKLISKKLKPSKIDQKVYQFERNLWFR